MRPYEAILGAQHCKFVTVMSRWCLDTTNVSDYRSRWGLRMKLSSWEEAPPTRLPSGGVESEGECPKRAGSAPETWRLHILVDASGQILQVQVAVQASGHEVPDS